MCELVKARDETIWQHYGQGHSARQIGRDLGINYRTATSLTGVIEVGNPAEVLGAVQAE